MKRRLITLISIVLVVIFMIGCSRTIENKTSTDEEQLESITVMVWDRGSTAPGTTQENNPLTEFIQESVLRDCNVRVTYKAIPRSVSDEKINVMMAGGNAPDIIITYDMNLVLDYLMQGGLAELSDAIEQFGPNIKKNNEEVLSLGYINEGQYMIPQIRGEIASRHLAYIRKDWLDTLGMEVPSTKEELIEVLYAFKEKDPGNVGKDKVIPWGVAGKVGTEKYFTNFVFSYAEDWDDKSLIMYQGYLKAIKPGTKEGYRVLNQLYKDGILSKDFIVDTNEEKYKQDIVDGYVGFLVDDTTAPASYYETLKVNVPQAQFIPIDVFENKNQEYIKPAAPLNGMYIIVPKTSEDKLEAIIKYLDWLAQPENANAILSTEVASGEGYPDNKWDYSIVNVVGEVEEEKRIDDLFKEKKGVEREYFEEVARVSKSELLYEPTFNKVLTTEIKYGVDIKKLIIEFIYKVICCNPAEFDRIYDEGYQKLLDAGLKEMLEERASYYDSQLEK